MNSTNILIITVILAILMVGGAVAFVVMSGQGGGGAAPAAATVAIEADYRPCVTDRDCMVVETHCGFCGQFDSIATIHEGVFNTIFNNQCGTYSGQSCNAAELNGYPACTNGQCTLVNMGGGL